jgi:hypothetical protein
MPGIGKTNAIPGNVGGEISQADGMDRNLARLPQVSLTPESRSILHADSQLTIGLVDRFDSVDTVPAKIVSRVFQMFFRVVQGSQRLFDFGMTARGWRGR